MDRSQVHLEILCRKTHLILGRHREQLERTTQAVVPVQLVKQMGEELVLAARVCQVGVLVMRVAVHLVEQMEVLVMQEEELREVQMGVLVMRVAVHLVVQAVQAGQVPAQVAQAVQAGQVSAQVAQVAQAVQAGQVLAQAERVVAG